MLSFARDNAPGAEFVAINALSLALPIRFDAALSTFNSLAHFADIGELTTVFRNVHAALRPGAPFLFDLSMEEAYASKWRGSFALVADDHACIVEPRYDADTQIGTNRITVFEVENRHSKLEIPFFRRSDFTITQKCHSESGLRDAVANAGFTSIQALDAQRDLGMSGESGRMFFLCR
jgi:SAM-dependent methyltransferase